LHRTLELGKRSPGDALSTNRQCAVKTTRFEVDANRGRRVITDHTAPSTLMDTSRGIRGAALMAYDF